MKIIDVLNKKGRGFHAIASHEGFDQILRLFVGYGVGSLVVTNGNGAAIGLVTERSITEALAQMNERAFDATAGRIMVTPAPACAPDLDVRDAMAVMTARRTRHLVVADDVATYGIVSLGDLVKFKLRETELENRVLRDIAGARRFSLNDDAVVFPGGSR